MVEKNLYSAEQHLDLELANPSSSAQLDQLRTEFPSEDLIASGVSGGAIEAFKIGSGLNRSGVSMYIPGVHKPTDIVKATLAENDSPVMGRNPRGSVVPFETHLVIDLPRRADDLIGDFRVRNIANFVLALTRHVTETAHMDLSVYLNDGTNSGLLYSGQATDAYLAEQGLESDSTKFIEESETSLNGILEIVSRRIDPDYDGLFVVTDLQDGYDPMENAFDWQESMASLGRDLSDRFWLTKVNSIAHSVLPYSAVEGLDLEITDAINEAYADRAREKTGVVEEFFQGSPNIRVQQIDLARRNNPDHPVNLMTNHVLGQVIN